MSFPSIRMNHKFPFRNLNHNPEIDNSAILLDAVSYKPLKIEENSQGVYDDEKVELSSNRRRNRREDSLVHLLLDRDERTDPRRERADQTGESSGRHGGTRRRTESSSNENTVREESVSPLASQRRRASSEVSRTSQHAFAHSIRSPRAKLTPRADELREEREAKNLSR